ncbi:MAG: hypothetical protein WDA06_04610 [Phenylobacterium sp.]
MLQLLSENEYGQVAILQSANDEDYATLIQTAKDKVTELNFNNALTESEQQTNWDGCFPMIFDVNGDGISNAFFSGRKGNSYIISLVSEQGVEEFNIEEKNVNIKYFIGTIVRDRKKKVQEDIYAKDQRNRNASEYVNWDRRIILTKTVFYIRHFNR